MIPRSDSVCHGTARVYVRLYGVVPLSYNEYRPFRCLCSPPAPSWTRVDFDASPYTEYILHIHMYSRVYFQRTKLPWWPMILQIYAIAALQ